MPMFIQRFRKGLVAAASVVAIAAATLGVVAPNAWADSGDLTLLPPEYHKTAVDNGDGTATITLSVKGDSNSSSEREPIDVVLVLDTSGSMEDYHRLSNVKAAAKGLTEQLLTDENSKLDSGQQVQVSVIEFNTHASVKQDFTSSKSQADWAINDLKADGGTNWEAGLNKANAATSNRGAKKCIVFLTDGNPTFHDTKQADKQEFWYSDRWGDHYRTVTDDYNNTYGCYGDGKSDRHSFNYDAAATEAKKRGNAALYVVKAATDAGQADNFSAAVKATNGDAALDGTTADALKTAFKNIATEIKREASYVNVSMTDTLSQWVEWQTKDGQVDTSSFVYAKKDSAGKDVAWNTTDGKAPEATVDANGKLAWNLKSENGGKLEKDATYSISFKVNIKERTYEDAASDSPAFADGEYPTNDKAQLSYTARQEVTGQEPKDESATKDFEEPKITIPVNTVTVNKVWDDNSDVHDSIQVKVGDKTVTLSKDGNWAATVKLPVSRKDKTYSVSEVEVPGYTSSASRNSITFKGGTFKEATDSVTIVNKPITGVLTVSKRVQGSAANKNKKYHFTVTVDADHKDAVAGKNFGNYAFDADGTASFDLAHGETATITGLPYDSSYSVVESGIDTNAATRTTASVNDETSKDLAITNQTAAPVDVALAQRGDKYQGSVDFINSSTAVPDNGIDTSNVGPMAALFGAAALGGVAMWEMNRRKSTADARKE